MSEQVPGMPPVAPIPPPGPITVDDILKEIEDVKLKELSDKNALEAIGNMSTDELKNKLIEWGKSGFPCPHVILQIPIHPPSICSDGIRRDLSQYIQYCSGKPIHEHVMLLQNKISGIILTFSNFGSYIGILVFKA
jgi:hypothetical protein